MRIPSEILPPFLREIDRTSTPEGRKTEPIEASFKLGGSLSPRLPEQQHSVENEQTSAGENHEKKLIRRKNHAISASKERREHERRRQKLPVLLDTRLTRHRRGSSRDSAVDFEI